MCWMAVATAASLVGTGISAYSAYQQGQSEKAAAEYNANVMEMQADDAIQRGADEAAEKKQDARKIASQQGGTWTTAKKTQKGGGGKGWRRNILA